MAKLTLTDITAGFGSNTQLNANFDAIETAFENTLSRDGTAPNTMSADLDMNSNDVLNVNSLAATSITLGGQAITATAGTINPGSVGTTELANAAVTTTKLANNSVDGTKISLSGEAQGDILYFDGTNWLVLPAGISGQFLKTQGSGANPTWDTVSTGTEPSDGDKGDITVSGAGLVWTIDNNVVSNAKLSDVATNTIKGRVTASTGDVEDLTGTQATTLLDVFTSSLKGLTPASGGGTTNFLRADGTWADPGASTITRGTAQNTTSGTFIDFTNIASGVNRITVMMSQVSTNGTDNLLIQLGDSGGIETSGYFTSASDGTGSNDSTSGFILTRTNGSGRSWSGSITFTRLDGNEWVSNGCLTAGSGGAGVDDSAGRKTLSAELNRLRLTTIGGTNSFDAGKINILIE